MNALTVAGLSVASITVVAISATAAYQDFNPYAEVVSVKPAMQAVVVSRESCRDERVTYTRDPENPDKIIASIAGAVMGDAIDTRVGSGSRQYAASNDPGTSDATANDATTVIVTVAGGYAGNKIKQSMQGSDTYETTERVCVTIQDSTLQKVGYDVTYRLSGRDQDLRMDHDPGSRIPLADGQVVLAR